MIHFWNGNKSAIRQAFELKVLQLALEQSVHSGEIYNDQTDYPRAEDEGNIFNLGADVLVTVAGNKKFAKTPFLQLPQPLCKGLLGCRVLIVHRHRQHNFARLSEAQLKQMTVGIPATWADADLFRANQYPVLEQGSLEEMLIALQNGECDYMALGANEAEAILAQYASLAPDLIIEPSLLLYYPFPLVFYFHPQQQALLKALQSGLQQARASGQLDQLFEQVYGADLAGLALDQRRVFHLTNPILPATLADYRSDLLPTEDN
ncbi:transporter substrate-binding domain-containing protein [Vibrio sp. CAU 1672]|uniref:substrate-binding periplasmic protein n=1 Tax=Vibrio sp. CAU 1672 TaxID=3032594 RepID=UPI0023DBE0AE|nr:transporter substrate-binding domain-containing protein [Vibrio sp. CAU 1672]MDF2155196.1 transporter substrate-binding domain-containing protein [Vibrio sp. CAU 1672]